MWISAEHLIGGVSFNGSMFDSYLHMYRKMPSSISISWVSLKYGLIHINRVGRNISRFSLVET